MNTGLEPTDAEALFGSAARRDGDAFSDIDYLIVGENAKSLRSRKWWLASLGFSVFDYTWNRLARAFAAGTLFALHLKREARPIIDRNGRLRELFESFQPKTSYDSDYEESLQLFRPLERLPASFVGRAWALDTLAVAFRNAAILLLAKEGQYVFSMKSIVKELRARGRINREQAASLYSLRISKARYRSGLASHVGRHQLDGVLQAVQAALKLDSNR
jgi:predicted nucleotidyltransferase